MVRFFTKKEPGETQETTEIGEEEQTEVVSEEEVTLVNEEEEARLVRVTSQYLNQKHAKLKIASLVSEEAKEELKGIIAKEMSGKVSPDRQAELVDKILRENVGLGLLEEILQDETITDIVYNGTELVLESNTAKWVYEKEVSNAYMEKIATKLANSDGKEFTTKDPILDIQFHHLRVNAVHSCLSTAGMTLAIRVSRPSLVLTEANFSEIAPLKALRLLQACVGAMCNFVLSGETGAGKTELQKLLIEGIPFNERIALVEDVPESHVKPLFPDKDVLSWYGNERIGMDELIKAGLRNNPKWLMVTEMRYAKEAYEWLQGIMTDHHSITTVHAVTAEAIPDRILSMILEEFSVNEDRFLRNIRTYVDIGVQVKVRVIGTRKVRYISEILYYGESENHCLFTQRCDREGKLSATFHDPLPLPLYERMMDFGQEARLVSEEKKEEEHVSTKEALHD
ncbi:CpaF/VirB11 family protein [Enterococcus rivorum]|uniref:Bacterial type II secretion system protein E domain-containing protein n=1 Tax=Enterococcus rivorum TaxID=762845 RepID=A0A1E5L0I6_9ENTE|nr:CpaF/VirB11 family protein [Enterococcus rivorum]MBP2098903.1 pilus assembly protein CpaF [Enterococcus rivorum]OEH83628.1 hypothetical protein BCR26_09125 [Enterococcus rivorum]